MSKLIEEYYAQANVIPFILNQKMVKLQRHQDISQEFEYWIEHQSYREDGLVIHGYSAKKLAALSEFLDGEGAFMLLIELRETPDKAKNRISQGFSMK